MLNKCFQESGKVQKDHFLNQDGVTLQSLEKKRFWSPFTCLSNEKQDILNFLAY